MPELQSTTRAFQSVLKGFHFSQNEALIPEEFAIKRFQKKFQEPDLIHIEQRKQQCWQDWYEFDQNLNKVTNASFLRFGVLYKTRDSLKRLSRVRLDTYDFPKGSEFIATRGQNSIESRLSRSPWTCTHDNFELFAQFVHDCKAMKRAFRKRYQQYYRKSFVENRSSMDKYIFRRYKELGFKNPSWESFKYKLSLITTFTHGSRFSRVPKNNSVDRPINIEPIGNIVTQRQIGNWIRTELKRLFSIDLDTLSQTHRYRIRDVSVATIDLKNASDSIAISLCQFLLPRHLFDLLMKSRSEFLIGLDGQYHPILKISSMGNGFTFELMTLILVAVARQFDSEASVFGDDIIIANDKAKDLIDVLEGVGFIVNKEKSFINSPFRESCGANFHDDFGYIESYDFRWPETVHDCIVIYNKVLRLSMLYPNFERLRLQLRRHCPTALQGVIEDDFFKKEIIIDKAGAPPYELSNFFRTRPHSDFVGLKQPKLKAYLVKYALKYNYTLDDLCFFKGLTYTERLRSPTRRSLHKKRDWAKYEMYLYSNRVSKDSLTGRGDWVNCLYLSVAGTTLRWSESALL